MCTAPLTAFPGPEVAITSEEDAVDRMFNPQSYFQNDTQRALWHLGDYGVATDAWWLFSIPQREQTLTERRLRVLKLEALAQVERQGYEEACDKAMEDTRSTCARLHRAGIVERIHPYLKGNTTILKSAKRGDILIAWCSQICEALQEFVSSDNIRGRHWGGLPLVWSLQISEVLQGLARAYGIAGYFRKWKVNLRPKVT
ncbi:hypothetical protein BC826DRAFT_973458 [Russula brevipes]|nr:hypothetical protein BC826DRAFT_973458 [Russula brevipes]